MQAKIGELRNRLSHYLRKVEQGEEVVVLDRDRPIARLVSIADREPSDTLAQRLIRLGLAQAGPQQGVKEILDDLPPGDSPAGVLEALIQERREEP
jgi:prevent-host-death family protein